jgi:diguanylate cyclase (GGDEF)-like protein
MLAGSHHDDTSGLCVAGPGAAGGARAAGPASIRERLRRMWRSQKSNRPEETLLYRPAEKDRSPARLSLPLVGPIVVIVILLLSREPENMTALISVGFGIVALVYGLFAAWLDGRTRHSLGAQLFHTGVYAAIITGLLIFFLVVDHPRLHAHWIVFFLYFLLIGAMGLARDPRVTVAAGAFAILGYLYAHSVVHAAAAEGVLVAQRIVPEFGWLASSAKVSILAGMTLTATASAARGLVVRRISIRDPLTGLLNRGAFDACLVLQASKAKARTTPLAIAMIDIDHFKKLNDTHGHSAGNAVLTWIASRLRHSVGDTDLVARYGGEEFVVAFVDSDHERLDERMEAWRRDVEASVLRIADSDAPIRVTVSIGIARFPTEAGSLSDALSRADERLYDAKRSGRNRLFGGAPAFA